MLTPFIQTLLYGLLKSSDLHHALYFEYADNVLVNFDVGCESLASELDAGYRPASIKITMDQATKNCTIQFYTFNQRIYKKTTGNADAFSAIVPRLELFTYVNDNRTSNVKTIQATENPMMYYLGGLVQSDSIMERFSAEIQHLLFPCGEMGRVRFLHEDRSISIELMESKENKNINDANVLFQLPEASDNYSTFTKEWIESNGYTGGACGYEGKTFYNHVMGNSKLRPMNTSTLEHVNWTKYHALLDKPNAAFYYPEPIPFWIQLD